MPGSKVGESIPPDTEHAVSVSLPTWRANIGYEEGEDWVLKSMVTGYPRFFIHKRIQAFSEDLARDYGSPDFKVMLFPTKKAAARCMEFIEARVSPETRRSIKAKHLRLDPSNPATTPLQMLKPEISAVLYPEDVFAIAKQYWQHTGDGVSSRRAEFCHGLYKDGLLHEEKSVQLSAESKLGKGPRRYQRRISVDIRSVTTTLNGHSSRHKGNMEAKEALEETCRFLEERFGRNLDLSLVQPAKSAIRRRIAGALRGHLNLTKLPLPEMGSSSRDVADPTERDVFLFPCGMNAIFHAHRMLMRVRGSMRSVNFGFPYVDTLKVLEKFGPGVLFYGHASEDFLDDLEKRLEAGEGFLGLFCEFPGNPLLTCPNLARIRQLADRYDFAVVIDETIGTFANVDVLQFADIVVSSLTKIFSGDCNVMGGGMVLHPGRRYYSALQTAARQGGEYEDTYWAEDVIFLERNSRDFAQRIERVNANAEAICDTLLAAQDVVKQVHYPKHNADRENYERCKLPGGGYGGLLSVVFHRKEQVIAFYDAIDTAKGPSLGTNFTLTSPYVILAHYNELEWAASLGVDPSLVRVSVGLEETELIVGEFRRALEAARRAMVV